VTFETRSLGHKEHFSGPLQVVGVLEKTSEGVAGMQQTGSAVVQILAQMQADRRAGEDDRRAGEDSRRAGEDARTKQRSEATRSDAAKSILADKDTYPQEIVKKAEQFLLKLWD
jgi:hypothetical protein